MKNTEKNYNGFIWAAVTLFAAMLHHQAARFELDFLYMSLCRLSVFVPAVFTLSHLGMYLIRWAMRNKNKPKVEIKMLSRQVKLASVFAIILAVIISFGKLKAFIGFFSIFGGLLLGMSLQSPMSGLVAWILISLKRSIRPGDRVQFPNLNLTGDVEDTGAMYLTLNQVGGSITSEEAVGRRVLIPNAMLFTNVAINYTVSQDAAYILDEVVVRITYNSDWEKAEEILLKAAEEVTSRIIEATGTKPYIRSTLYDYGVYLRLRFKTRVKDRAEIAYNIEKRIFEEIQKNPAVDIAIPYVYSYRTAMDENSKTNNSAAANVAQIELGKIKTRSPVPDLVDIKQIAESISEKGLLQPIVVEQKDDSYEVVAGHLRFEACKYLGWEKISAVLRN